MSWLQAVVVALTEVHGVDDSVLIEARARQRFAILSYVNSWSQLRGMPTYGGMFEEPTLELLMNRAFYDLLLNIGCRLLADRERRELPPVPLIVWRQPPLGMMRITARQP